MHTPNAFIFSCRQLTLSKSGSPGRDHALLDKAYCKELLAGKIRSVLDQGISHAR